MLALALLLFAACRSESVAAPAALSTGTYALQSIDGVPLPVIVFQTTTSRTRVLADTLRFGPQEGRYFQLPVLGMQQGTEPERVARVSSSTVLTAMMIRRATPADLPAVVRLLADDPLGASREQYAEPLPAAYLAAFAAMEEQVGNELLVATTEDEVVGCLQLTVIPGVSRLGASRAQIEGVRVAAAHRGAGIGEALVEDAIARAKRAGCTLVQLTTDTTRVDAKRFYERLGFAATQIGMKLTLDPE